MKILSISDLITNSSSEVFCIISSQNQQVLEEIYEFLPNCESFRGEGGVYLTDKGVEIRLDNSVFGYGIDELLQLGIEKILIPWNDKISVSYE